MLQKVLVGGVVALALALTSCGSGEPKPLTRAELAQQAGAICKKRAAAFTAVRKRAREGRQAISAAMPAMEDSVKQLSSLKPPAELRSAYEEIVAAERHQLAMGRAFLAGRRVGESETGAPLHRHVRLRAQLGMSACD